MNNTKNIKKETLDDVLQNGGTITHNGVRILVDTDLESEKTYSGYYIISALGHRVFFRTGDRAKAQKCCSDIFGKGFYSVRTV